MRYLPICAKYGQVPYYIMWVVMPYAAMAVGYLYFSICYLVSYLIFGPFLEHETTRILHKRRVGITRGTRILHRAQIAGVFLAMFLGLGAEKLADLYMHPDFKPAVKVASQLP